MSRLPFSLAELLVPPYSRRMQRALAALVRWERFAIARRLNVQPPTRLAGLRERLRVDDYGDDAAVVNERADA